MGAEGEGGSLRWLDFGGAEGWQGEEAEAEMDSWGIGLPFQAPEEAVNKKRNKLNVCSYLVTGNNPGVY